MNLRNELTLPAARIVDLTKYPRSPEPSRVLTIVLPLKPSIAESLKCRDMVYDVNDQPRHFEGSFGLDHELDDCEIKLSNSNGAKIPVSPRVIKKFRIGHDAKENLTLTLRCHFVGYGNVLEEWSDDINDAEFDCSILSLQGELFPDNPGSKKDGPEGGKRVDLSKTDEMVSNLARAGHGPVSDDELVSEFGSEDGPCIACNNRIPYEDANKKRHATGALCTRTMGSGTVASAVAAAGGTTEALKRGRGRPRKEQPPVSTPTPAEREALEALGDDLDNEAEALIDEDEAVPLVQ